jgi:hypothetical protein
LGPREVADGLQLLRLGLHPSALTMNPAKFTLLPHLAFFWESVMPFWRHLERTASTRLTQLLSVFCPDEDVVDDLLDAFHPF